MIRLVLAGIVGYLLGSVTAGMIVPRFMGTSQDVRKEGSGNVGATNVLRTQGKLQGALVLVGDLLKGSLAALLGMMLAGYAGGAIAGGCALLGHCYPLYFGFQGGKGVATAAGIILALFPQALLFLIPAFVIAIAVTRMVSVGSIAAAVTLVVCILLFHPPAQVGWVCFFAAAMVTWKHEGNIKRILAGTENKL